MQTILKNLTHFVLISCLLFLITSCKKDDPIIIENIDYGTINVVSLETQLLALPTQFTDTNEVSDLVFSREEEKLARDVYSFMINKWGSIIFTNISTSEQTHMDAILMLLNKYNIIDPVDSNAVGVFTNSALQVLYNHLVSDGSASALAAFKVGATIEDLDIYDLTEALSATDNQDIRLVYSMLIKGSRNHLRSFYSNILKLGGTYTPQYITQIEFDAIVNSSMETGF